MTDPLGCGHVFGYRVVRLWEMDAAVFLGAGVGTLALAPLARPGPGGVPAVLTRVNERSEEVADDRRERFWRAVGILMGLRFEPGEIRAYLTEARGVEENAFTRVLQEMGAEREVRRTILRQGTRRFGPPDESVGPALERITDLERLRSILDSLPERASWADLLSEPT